MHNARKFNLNRGLQDLTDLIKTLPGKIKVARKFDTLRDLYFLE